jgi:hypothetical protein
MVSNGRSRDRAGRSSSDSNSRIHEMPVLISDAHPTGRRRSNTGEPALNVIFCEAIFCNDGLVTVSGAESRQCVPLDCWFPSPKAVVLRRSA